MITLTLDSAAVRRIVAPRMSSGRAKVAARSRTSDAELVAAMACGDRDALAALYDRYAGLLLATAARIVGTSGAEDLVHDVLVEAWQRAAGYEEARGSVRTWLLLRLRSRALDLCRREHRRPWEPLSPQGDRAAEGEGYGAQDPLSRVEQARARAAISRLSPSQRQIVELAYFGGLTMVEIAEALGIPIGTVKSRSSAALSRLRAALCGPGGER